MGSKSIIGWSAVDNPDLPAIIEHYEGKNAALKAELAHFSRCPKCQAVMEYGLTLEMENVWVCPKCNHSNKAGFVSSTDYNKLKAECERLRMLAEAAGALAQIALKDKGKRIAELEAGLREIESISGNGTWEGGAVLNKCARLIGEDKKGGSDAKPITKDRRKDIISHHSTVVFRDDIEAYEALCQQLEGLLSELLATSPFEWDDDRDSFGCEHCGLETKFSKFNEILKSGHWRLLHHETCPYRQGKEAVE